MKNIKCDFFPKMHNVGDFLNETNFAYASSAEGFLFMIPRENTT